MLVLTIHMAIHIPKAPQHIPCFQDLDVIEKCGQLLVERGGVKLSRLRVQLQPTDGALVYLRP
jgi:hypothetical protein